MGREEDGREGRWLGRGRGEGRREGETVEAKEQEPEETGRAFVLAPEPPSPCNRLSASCPSGFLPPGSAQALGSSEGPPPRPPQPQVYPASPNASPQIPAAAVAMIPAPPPHPHPDTEGEPRTNVHGASSFPAPHFGVISAN